MQSFSRFLIHKQIIELMSMSHTKRLSPIIYNVQLSHTNTHQKLHNPNFKCAHLFSHSDNFKRESKGEREKVTEHTEFIIGITNSSRFCTFFVPCIYPYETVYISVYVYCLIVSLVINQKGKINRF